MKNLQADRSPAVWDFADVLNRVDNDQELLRDLLGIFQEEFPRAMSSLEASVAAGDRKNISALSHKLKGMLSNLGATRAAAAAAKLEVLASAGDQATLSEAFAAVERESASLFSEIQAYLAEVHN